MAEQVITHDQVPSYARHTQASNDRKVSIPSKVDIPRALTPPSPQRWEIFRCYSASTIASRRRSKQPMPFRFLDLPPEIRNKIYEQFKLDVKPHYVDLQSLRARDPLQALPSLLQVSKQLCNEAGSYYFDAAKRFDMVLDLNHPHRFKAWLRLIGPLNRHRLASNPNVFVWLCQGPEREYRHWRTIPSNIARILSFVDGAGVAGLGIELQQCAAVYPPLLFWEFSAIAIQAVHRWRREKRNISCFRNLPLTVSDVHKMRSVMKLLMAPLGGACNGQTEYGGTEWMRVKESREHSLTVEGRDGSHWGFLRDD